MTTKVDITPAKRFINAYNAIDYALRAQYNFKNNISFSDLIRRCSQLNMVIKNHEDDLISYARLRNAIVHSVTDYVIAEPHEAVVKVMEAIARIVTTPPLAIDALAKQTVVTVQATLSLRQWLIEKGKYEYNNLPVYKGNTLIGVMYFRNYVSAIGKYLAEQKSIDEFVDNTTVEEFLQQFPSHDRQFQLVSARITIEQVLKAFNDSRKIICLIITKTGKALEQPMRIITRADIMDLMQVIEKY
jgi:predicted transcriptional regulator